MIAEIFSGKAWDSLGSGRKGGVLGRCPSHEDLQVGELV